MQPPAAEGDSEAPAKECSAAGMNGGSEDADEWSRDTRDEPSWLL
jgi:hypothetical protein